MTAACRQSAAAPASAGLDAEPGPSRSRAGRADAARGLRIGALTPLSTLDYPGELAAVLWCQGCPWRCGYCHNGHLRAPNGPDLLPWEAVLAFLGRRRGLLDAVVFSGGEPTTQQALAGALAAVRALGFKVGLHSAGPDPERLAALIPLLDWVGLDIKALPEDYERVTGVPGSGIGAWRSLDLLLAAGVALEVRTTPLPGLDAPAYLERLMQRLAAAGVRRYVLQQCRPVALLDPSLRARIAPLPARLAGASAFERFEVRRG